MQSQKIKKGGNSNIKGLHCNILNWSYLPFLYWSYLPFLYLSYLPFLFCAIALQSFKLDLPPFLFYAIAMQFIKLELPPSNLIDCNAIVENKKGR
jgi:hypothetical protein